MAKNSKPCTHEKIAVSANVVTIDPTGDQVVEIQLHCVNCEMPFSFSGLPIAINPKLNTMSVDGKEARLVIQPGLRDINRIVNAPRCKDCGMPYDQFGLDATLSDDQWLAISYDESNGLLCASCMVKRASGIPNSIAIRMKIVINPPEPSKAE